LVSYVYSSRLQRASFGESPPGSWVLRLIRATPDRDKIVLIMRSRISTALLASLFIFLQAATPVYAARIIAPKVRTAVAPQPAALSAASGLQPIKVQLTSTLLPAQLPSLATNPQAVAATALTLAQPLAPRLNAQISPARIQTAPLLPVLPELSRTPAAHATSAKPSARTSLRQLYLRAQDQQPLSAFYDGGILAAADSVDSAGTPSYKPQRTDLINERAAYELETEVDGAFAELSEIHAQEMKGATVDSERKRILLRTLTRLYNGVPGPAVHTFPWKELQATLATSREERKDVAQQLSEARQAGRSVNLAAFNTAAVRANQTVLKVQLQTARIMLSRQAPLKAKSWRRNAALWTLTGAFHSALQLKSEIRFQALLSRARQRVHEYWTHDGAGHPVRVFSLDGFDIELHSGSDANALDKPEVTVRQQRWRNTLTSLATIARDVRAQRDAAAIERLADLERLYTIDYAGLPISPPQSARYAEIAASLNALRDAVRGLPKGTARRSAVVVISESITTLSETLLSPKISSWRDISYADLATAIRSQAHTLASQQDEIGALYRNAADLRLSADVIAVSLPAAERKIVRRLPKKEQDETLAMLKRLQTWTARGQVRAKQNASRYLTSAVNHLRAGEPQFALDFINRAATQLENRAVAIDGMMTHVRRRAAGLYAEFRDRDILGRSAQVLSALQVRRLSPARRKALQHELSQLQEVYFASTMPEPGYQRAANHLTEAIQHIDQRRYANAAAALRLVEEGVRHKLRP
jgi:hypothetical protein